VLIPSWLVGCLYLGCSAIAILIVGSLTEQMEYSESTLKWQLVMVLLAAVLGTMLELTCKFPPSNSARASADHTKCMPTLHLNALLARRENC
jgi:hypothetical protein